MNKQQGLNVAIVGATGAVGVQMLKMLEGSTLPIAELKLLASKRSVGQTREFKSQTIRVEEARPESFEGIDIALFSAGGAVSKQLAPEAAKRGAVVVDNTSAFRMDPEVPLVVPEVNPEALREHKGIIANPNCSTIQMVVALEPLRQAYELNRVVVSTYQAVSGAGQSAINELTEQTKSVLKGEKTKTDKFPHQIAFNVIPQIDKFQENRYTFEEMKMINETRKIMDDHTLKVAATCVRLPVAVGHAESVYVELGDDKDVSVDEVIELLSKAPGVTVVDDPEHLSYPMPVDAAGKKEVFVGRIRKDLDVKNGLHLWIVSDNLLKGAAWNSVQIAETLVDSGIVKLKG
ncbi:aspartate-semialdehyde dehydrogenase [Pullulanibacillus pueri]|uniref:Aspartate-semialdehyde dehydrogenase n=1 Tax=Pullulanibacillus pueri TaxID=1437324 RepID=A0A8J2ZVP3_9BACL|nr:aspartate-semialdehyde dehydrogenase [Pullulanibacillus pueri]MBM7682529.1 aspartate-semialdehyde dehydrogenase [Pullulanibacillus pueri]GGH82037.1 aspartate-semialdehyde dehydrogenase [Pullulanibacillus pueri]